ncbi:MAG: hypothetical protein ACRC10_02430 [Thermoguttaceae bacterium]
MTQGQKIEKILLPSWAIFVSIPQIFPESFSKSAKPIGQMRGE